MLKIIKNRPNLLPNLSKIENIFKLYRNNSNPDYSKYSFNLVSYKGEYSFNSKISVSKRTYEDYKKIREEGGYKLLTEDDMRWIDENVYEIDNFSS